MTPIHNPTTVPQTSHNNGHKATRVAVERKKAFCSFHGISLEQVRRLCDLLKTNEQPIDHRGQSEGSRINALSGETLTKVREHIESFLVICAHYYNKDASSNYLDEKLNVKIMHTLYEQKYPDYPVKYEYYLKYFHEKL